jgi:hypothetical protein
MTTDICGLKAKQARYTYGKFSTNLQTVYSWGVPRQVHFDGMMMDMDMLITLTGNHQNDKAQQKLLQQQLGMMNSTMEHLIPEQLLQPPSMAAALRANLSVVQNGSGHFVSTEESPAHGVSAVKAIQLAAAEGQKIYHITSANLETALAAIDLNTSVEREIREAVYAGKEVTTHSHRINFYGKVTAGYIIVDPLTGNGVYKIATGEDGAFLFLMYMGVNALFGISIYLVVAAIFTAGSIWIALGLIALVMIDWFGYKSWLKGISKAKYFDDFNQNAFDAAIAAIIGLLPWVAVFGKGKGLGLWMILASFAAAMGML